MKTFELINFGSNYLKDKGILSPSLDSEIILSHIVGVSRERILISEKENLSKIKSIRLITMDILEL